MPNWKKVVVSGSNAELSKLNVSTALTASGIIYPTSDGSADQVLKTDGSGNLSFSSGTGTQGATGAQGAIGSKGQKGAQGAVGSTGAQGIQGI